MRRVLIASLAAILALGTFGSLPARADGITSFVLELAESRLEGAQDSTGNTDFFIDLSSVSPTWFASHYAVFDARITYDMAAVLDPACPPMITLYTSDVNKSTTGLRVRRSAQPNVAVQRVAIAQPQFRHYLVSVRRNAAAVSTAGPCPTIASVPFRLTYKLFASAPKPTGAFTEQRMPQRGDGEPSIAVDRLHGDAVYISAPVGGPATLGGNPGGVDFWRSTGAGAAFGWSQPQFGNSTGGFDSHVVVAKNGTVYLADLGATTVFLGKSTDRGATWSALPAAAIDSDRQWFAAYTPPNATAPTKTFVSYHTINVDNLPYECIVTEVVSQLVCNPMATDPVVLAKSFGNTVIGNQLFDSTGTVYSLFGSPEPGDTGSNVRNLFLAYSSDGIVFRNTTVYAAPVGHELYGLFPVIAIDAADNLYAVWSERLGSGGAGTIRFSRSTDHGLTWSTPVDVSAAGHSAFLPWIVAGAAGKVDITWVDSTTLSPNDPTGDYYTFMAQSTNAQARTPSFTRSRVTPQPIRYGNVCLVGLNCTVGGDDGRILLDFISIDYDSAGRAAITFGNSGPEGPTDNPREIYTDYAHQTGGTVIK
jgi:hypothetical protein